ncbi:hypothetical protein JTB14_007176, partial [Gonioctena quinquepunctata]
KTWLTATEKKLSTSGPRAYPETPRNCARNRTTDPSPHAPGTRRATDRGTYANRLPTRLRGISREPTSTLGTPNERSGAKPPLPPQTISVTDIPLQPTAPIMTN